MTALDLRSLLKTDGRQAKAMHACWCDGRRNRRAADALDDLERAMRDEVGVEERLRRLPKKLADLLERFLADPETPRTVRDILREGTTDFLTSYEIEATLAALHREGFLLPLKNGFAVPAELAECIDRFRRRQANEIENTITLRGHLNSRYFDGKRAGGSRSRGPDHARKVYKLYLMENSILGRIRQLPPRVRKLWNVALDKYGGFLPVEEIPRALGDEEASRIDLDQVRTHLEDAMLGTVAPLRLARFGIRPSKAVVIVFYEITLICLQLHSQRFPVEATEESVSSVVDLASNVGRFLRELDRSKVQFTVEGKLYKASEKRISKCLLEVSGGFLGAQAQIRFIYHFCLSRRLVDRSGERALRPTEAGRNFDQQPLLDKLSSLLAYSVEEKGLPGEDYHQVRLRRILLRLLRRLEVGQWHELLFVPFLARNSYLSKLDSTQASEYFATRFQMAGYLPTENVQQICWNLLAFIKQRLYPLGLIELGLRDGRPVALRLSRLGAELLGTSAAAEVGGARSQAVVNPDFEVLVFPGEDEHEVVHSFDRFARREKSDHVHHFRLSRESIATAVREGMSVAEVVQALQDHSRTPLPQNVLYSLEDWGGSEAKAARGGAETDA